MTPGRAEIAGKMVRGKEAILRRWEKRVREEIPESRDKDREAIRNSLPDLLEKIASTLAEEPPKGAAEFEKELMIARQHGRQRAQLKNYSIAQVVHEYQLLREVIIEELEQDRPLVPGDRDVVLTAISLGQRISAREFHELQLKSARELETRTREKFEAERQRDQSRGEVTDLVSERKLREAFVSNLAHDLRTPITAARLNLELLSKKRNEPGALEMHVGRALADLTRLEAMIRDLLDANRITAGHRLPIKLERLDLAEEVADALLTLGGIHGDRFVLEKPDAIEGYWDRLGVRRIVENLCSNAIKYGSPTEPVTVTLRRSPTSAARVEIEVHNEGPVIAPEAQEVLFERFRRSAAGPDPGASHGWGIGLAIVKGMAESHGGSVRVRSSQVEGTCFRVTLPLDARGEAPARAA